MANDDPFSTTPKATGPPRRGRPPKNDSPRGRPPRGPRAPGDDEMPPEFAVATEEPEAPEAASVEVRAETGSAEPVSAQTGSVEAGRDRLEHAELKETGSAHMGGGAESPENPRAGATTQPTTGLHH